jgi:NADH:ubiquinone oxidoreductase subunit F (NADH-binding)
VDERRLLPDAPIESFDAYRRNGGGRGLAVAAEIGPSEVIDRVRRSGLRGRGGAGFPTGLKWHGVADEPWGGRHLVCNAAEGEPGTFKDRALIRANPYQVLEGIAIAALAIGAEQAHIGIKARFRREIEALERAGSEMEAAGAAGSVPISIVTGPDDYLFGEEKGLLEVIEGRDPLPRLVPPYVQGLFTAPAGPPNPTVVNNVETLANVPLIVANGADWFRRTGTRETPGTMLFTVSGDVRRETVVELPAGAPLSLLIYGPGEGLEAGRRPRMVVSGASNPPLSAEVLDTPLSFEAMAAVGSGLGAGGFIVYDDTACVVQAGAVLSSFLAGASCGQCPPCKLGTQAIAVRLDRIHRGAASPDDLDEIAGWIERVTDANRCGLGAGQRSLAAGLAQRFGDELQAHVGAPCGSARHLPVPLIDDHDPASGRFILAGEDGRDT